MELMDKIWPVVIIVASNCFYNICTKSTPEDVNAFGALLATYLTAAAVTAVLFLCDIKFENVFSEMSKVNWTSFIRGAAVVGLEVGYILLYRAGWQISSGALVANICLAFALILIGALLYKEQVTVRQILGVGVCLIGLILIR